MSQSYTILEWDTTFFGYRIARYQQVRTTHAILQDVVLACSRDLVDCLYVLAEADDVETVEALEEHGFGFKDIRMTYRHDHVSSLSDQSQSREEPVLIRPVRSGEVAMLEAIARVSHTDTRFYYDRHFSPDRAADLYQAWIRRSCEGAADVVLVSEGTDQNGLTGYISCHLSDTTGQIGLLAVDERARWKGIGQLLVQAALLWFNSQNVTNVEVVTQGRNLAAQRLYQKAGFTVRSMQLWYHKWFDPSS